MSEQATHDWIRKTIAANDVVLFMKGTSKFPQCGFSAQVTQMLGHLGVPFKDVNVLDDVSIRDGIKTFTNWPSICVTCAENPHCGNFEVPFMNSTTSLAAMVLRIQSCVACSLIVLLQNARMGEN